VEATEYKPGEQRGQGLPKWRQALHLFNKLLPWNLLTSFVYQWDTMPPGRANQAEKGVHKRAVVFLGKLRVGDVIRDVFVRLSFAVPPVGPGRNVTPGLAIKITTDGESSKDGESSNVLLMEAERGALGQGDNANPFAAKVFANRFRPLPRKAPLPVRIIAFAFSMIRREPNTLMLPPKFLAALGLSPNTETLELHLTDAATRLVASDVADPVLELTQKLHKGLVLADGNVTLTAESRAIESRFADEHAFFGHWGWDTRTARFFAWLLGYGKSGAAVQN
jgi:hypothetical protein